jgi:galactose mutarotase-like enzyme
MVGERRVEGFRAVTLAAPVDGVEASFVPGAGMVGCSLLHRGEELLGQRGGLSAYVANRSTMGIPLLHPWANRLSARRFDVDGGRVDLDAGEPPPPSTDSNALPIHGLLAAGQGWEVVSRGQSEDGGSLVARHSLTAHPGLPPVFPFPHELEIGARSTRRASGSRRPFARLATSRCQSPSVITPTFDSQG